MNVTVLGAGTWGAALAALLRRNGHEVVLWSALPEELTALAACGVHPHLPNARMPKGIRYEADEAVACCKAQLVLFVTPSVFVRQTARRIAPYIPSGAMLVSAAKGLEHDTLFTMTEIIEEEVRGARPCDAFHFAALSGPTHAEEVAQGLPTSIVAACENEAISMDIARAFANTCLRVYTNTDVRGVEICGALKNIVAIAAGISRGMGFGDNAGAMLITRGIAEIGRVGLAMGCNRQTFMGLAGVGDLIVTCTSRHSRNNRCGELVGSGMTYAQAQAQIGMVVEGYHALDGAMALASRYGVEMPITAAVYDVLKHDTTPAAAMRALMTRELKNEAW